MNAEERAREMGKYFGWDASSEQVNVIAQALRTARNEALEESAKIADEEGKINASSPFIDPVEYERRSGIRWASEWTAMSQRREKAAQEYVLNKVDPSDQIETATDDLCIQCFKAGAQSEAEHILGLLRSMEAEALDDPAPTDNRYWADWIESKLKEKE